MVILSEYAKILQVLKFIGKMITSHDIFLQKNTIENCFGTELFQLSAGFQIFCLQLNEIENIREIQLSESRNYTLDQLQGNHKADHSVKF